MYYLMNWLSLIGSSFKILSRYNSWENSKIKHWITLKVHCFNVHFLKARQVNLQSFSVVEVKNKSRFDEDLGQGPWGHRVARWVELLVFFPEKVGEFIQTWQTHDPKLLMNIYLFLSGWDSYLWPVEVQNLKLLERMAGCALKKSLKEMLKTLESIW